MDDIDRFPTRRIPTGVEANPWVPGSLVGYDTLLAPVRLGGSDRRVPLKEFLETNETTAFLVARGDSLLLEWYLNGFRGDSLHTVFSVSKSILSAALGAAIERGSIRGLDEPITRYVPELMDRDSAFSAITLRHLVTMSSGLKWEDSMSPWGDPADTYYSTDLRGSGMSAEIAEPPGHHFVYNNYNPLLIGLAVERSTGTTVSELFSSAVWKPMGAEADASWSLDRGDGGFEKMESGFNARPRDLARFGALYRDGGRARGRQVLQEDWVAASVRADSTSDPNPEYQYFWWVGPRDDEPPHFWAEGRFGQFVYVVPDLDLVMVRLGRDDGDVDWRTFFPAIARRVRAADAANPAASQ